MTRKREPKVLEPETPRGIRIQIDALRCIRCGRTVTAEDSIDKRMGHVCYVKTYGETEHARLERAGQMPMPWISEERAN